MAKAEDYTLVEVTVPVTVRVPVTGLEELEDTLARAWRVVNALDGYPVEREDQDAGVVLEVHTYSGHAHAGLWSVHGDYLEDLS